MEAAATAVGCMALACKRQLLQAGFDTGHGDQQHDMMLAV
jgi:hypothetical protein